MPADSAAGNLDPINVLRKMWSNMGVPLPGLLTPTLDADELQKNITDLKAVEGWLKANLSLLQMNIQTLELQRASLVAFKAMGSAVQDMAEARSAAAEAAKSAPPPAAEEAPAAASVGVIAPEVIASLFNPATWGISLGMPEAAKPAADAPESAAPADAGKGGAKAGRTRKPKA